MKETMSCRVSRLEVWVSDIYFVKMSCVSDNTA